MSTEGVKARAFAPGHITGFFEIHDNENPRNKGSTGCGIALDRGIETTVTVSDRTEITLNGKTMEAETTRTLIEMLTDKTVKVESRADIPIGCGFGASGAGGLSTGYALNQALSLALSANQITEAAHIAEVRNGSGLGDVVAQANGGIAIRTKPGAPGFGALDRIPSGNLEVYFIVLGELSTRSVLEDMDSVSRINSAGHEALKELLKRPTIENFMSLSRNFAASTQLASDRALDVIEAMETEDCMASQAMLGDTVFAIGKDGKRVHDTLSEFGEVMKYGVSLCSTRLI